MLKVYIERRDDAQSQLDALMGENPAEAAILEQRIQTLNARIEAEQRSNDSPYYRGGGAIDSITEWRHQQAKEA